MKQIKLVVTAVLVITGFIACKNSPTIAQQDAMNLNSYVDSVENLTPVYTTAYWSELDNGYQVRVAKADNTMATLETSDKAELDESKIQYAVLKTTYEIKDQRGRNKCYNHFIGLQAGIKKQLIWGRHDRL